jgi:ATP-dependent RNA helicase SUPV3L1/SUV3
MAEKLLRAAHDVRVKAGPKSFVIDPALAVSIGLATPSYAQLLRQGGFAVTMPRPLHEGQFGPPQPPRWRWRPLRKDQPGTVPLPPPRQGSAFSALAEMLR